MIIFLIMRPVSQRSHALVFVNNEIVIVTPVFLIVINKLCVVRISASWLVNTICHCLTDYHQPEMKVQHTKFNKLLIVWRCLLKYYDKIFWTVSWSNEYATFVNIVMWIILLSLNRPLRSHQSIFRQKTRDDLYLKKTHLIRAHNQFSCKQHELMLIDFFYTYIFISVE